MFSLRHAWARRIGLLMLLLPFLAGPVMGDGNETLGPPSVLLASGSRYIVEGVGLALAQPGILGVTVPAGASVRQVLLYWEGQHSTPAGDNGIVVNGNAVTGTLIGGPDFFFLRNGTLPVYSSTYRADITSLDLVQPGVNALAIQGLTFDIVNNGAGVLVIVDDGTNAGLQLRDGNDLAYRFFPVPRAGTVPQTFIFDPAAEARTARLAMFFSSVQGTASTGGPQRPNRIAITVGAVTTNHDDVLNSNDGEEWDTWEIDVNIPAGVTQVTVEPISGPGGDEDPGTSTPRPASFAWLAAGFSMPLGGGEGCTPGYWKQSQHFGSWTLPYGPGTPFGNVFENAFPGKTLLQVLQLGGGGLNALGRHTVAALLNAASGGVDYDLTTAQVIAMFNAVYPGTNTAYTNLKDIFEDYNEQGCPLARAVLPGAAAMDDAEVMKNVRLLQNYPNPFNPSTEVVFQVAAAGDVKIRVFDMLGREVRMLADGWFEAGVHSVSWDATDAAGRPVVSGTYFAQMQTDLGTQITRMALMR